MDKEQLLALLKEHLTVEVSMDISYGSFGESDRMVTSVKISFDGETIDESESSTSLPQSN